MATRKKTPVRKKATKKKATKKVTKKNSTPINTPEKYVFGRPSKYDRSYPEKVYNACKSGECLTVASICCLLDIDRETYHEWGRKYPDFFGAIKKGLEYRKAHMEKMGLEGTQQGKQFNGAPWIFLMKNMFPDEYRERQEVKVEDETPKDKPQKRFAFDLSESPASVHKRGGDDPNE